MIHAIGTAHGSTAAKRDEGCCFAQVIYGAGEGRLSVEGKTYDIHPGTCFFSAAGHAARLLAADGGMATNWLCFDGTCLPETVRCLGMEHSSVVELPDPTRFDALFKNVLTELHADPIFGQLRASPYVHRIWWNTT